MKPCRTRAGYILLISILVTGMIATAVVASLLMLGLSANNASLSVQQSSQSMALSQACADYALLKLFQNPTGYNGNEIVQFPQGSCTVLRLGGVDPYRFVCVESAVGDVTRRLQIIVSKIVPQIKIYSWQEVITFDGSCN